MKEYNFCTAKEKLENVLKHTKNFEFCFDSSKYYDYGHLFDDINDTKKAVEFAQENYLMFNTLIEHIVSNLEIENVYKKYSPFEFNTMFKCADYYTFKFCGKEIKVSGYTYLSILDWKIKQELRLKNE